LLFLHKDTSKHHWYRKNIKSPKNNVTAYKIDYNKNIFLHFILLKYCFWIVLEFIKLPFRIYHLKILIMPVFIVDLVILFVSYIFGIHIPIPLNIRIILFRFIKGENVSS
jgi:hypothetical protein